MAKCQGGAEKDIKADAGMGANYQGVENGGDEEMVVFFGTADPRAIEDRKQLKLTMKKAMKILDEGVVIGS
jgi:hypothetical protein